MSKIDLSKYGFIMVGEDTFRGDSSVEHPPEDGPIIISSSIGVNTFESCISASWKSADGEKRGAIKVKKIKPIKTKKVEFSHPGWQMVGIEVIGGEDRLKNNPPINGMVFPSDEVRIHKNYFYCHVHWTTRNTEGRKEDKKGVIKVRKKYYR